MLCSVYILVFIVTTVCLSSINCFFDDNVLVFADESIKNRYFGYSVLLQRGNPSLAIVGAPRSSDGGGSVYRCDLNASHCIKYNILSDNKKSANGNFFGVVLDGDEVSGGPFFTCAPREVDNFDQNNYMYGKCFYQKNSSSFVQAATVITPVKKEPISVDRYGQYYYQNAFAEAGISLAYIKEEGYLFLGTPGTKGWNGATNLYGLRDEENVIIQLEQNRINKYEYLGYSIAFGKLESTRKRHFYIAGAPRAHGLTGSVNIFEFDPVSSKGVVPVAMLAGLEAGSYFGSSIVAVDLDDDNIDDILVGAPMAGGKSWEEGYVYVFKVSERKITFKTKLYGSSQSGARFGSSITSLGDFDLDGFNDVAISAPFENGGKGAVYIYKGSSSGILEKFSQRIVPSDFKIEPNIIQSVQGFGLGLSKGNDIDGNGHNDLAIGAFESDQLFILKALSIIDFSTELISNEATFNVSTTEFDIKLCLSYTQRSKTQDITSLDFKLQLNLDYRTVGETNFEELLTIKRHKETCKNYTPKIQPTIKNISPFSIKVNVEPINTKVIAYGNRIVEQYIPFSHGCGSDNICVTDLSLTSSSKTTEIVVGKDDELQISIEVENFGEPAYQCELHLQLPENVNIKSPMNCNKKGDVFICPVDANLVHFKKVELILSTKNIDPSLSNFKLDLEAKSLGKNNGTQSKELFNVPVILENSPFILSKSEPESLNFPESADEKTETLEIYHKFWIGNNGPSPVKLDVDLFLPIIKNGEDIFKVLEVEGLLGDVDTECEPASNSIILGNETDETIQKLINAPLNRTLVLSCVYGNAGCIKYTCKGSYIPKLSQLAVFSAKFRIKLNLLAKTYAHELKEKSLLAFISTGYLSNSENESIFSHASTMIFNSRSEKQGSSIAIWIYVVGPIGGAILLVLLIFILYKFHFFDRNYKDKLNEEKLLDSSNGHGSQDMEGSQKSSIEDFQLENPNP